MRFVSLPQPEKISYTTLGEEESKLDKSRLVKFRHHANMYSAVTTLEVLKLVKSRLTRLLQSENMLFIFLTLDVSKPVKSKLVRLPHRENM